MAKSNSTYDVLHRVFSGLGEPSIVHFIVLIIMMGSPMLFFQTFVGMYSGRGCIFMGEMFPAAYGLGYAMLLISFVRYTYGVFYTIKISSFLFAALFSRNLPWMMCSYRRLPGHSICFGKTDIDLCPTRANSTKPCFKPHTRLLSTIIYKEFAVFMRVGNLTFHQKYFKLIYHTFHSLILLPLLLIFASKGIRSFAVSLRGSLIFCLGALVSIFMAVVTRPGAGTGFHMMFHSVNSNSLLDLGTWTTALRRVIQGLRLAEGGHFLFGSYIPESTESSTDFRRTIFLEIAFLIMVLCTMLYFHIVLGLLIFHLNMQLKDLSLESGEDTIFITYPTILGIQASSFFFSLIYFLVIFLLSFHALILKVFVIQKTITVQFDIHEYSLYIKLALILVAIILTYALEMTPYYKVIEVVENELKRFQTCALALQILVLFMYGLQRMSDDIHFHTNAKINKFVKFRWIATLIFCAASFYIEITTAPKKDFTIRMIVCGVICSPLVLFFIFKLFVYIRRKNVIGLLRASDLYGPPELEKRILRILYNPRLAIRCKGQEKMCFHNCLLRSSASEIALQEEINLIKKFLTDLQTNPSAALQTDIMPSLKTYEKILLKKLSKKESK